ncbi:MAG: IS66 family transposase [Nitrospinae bacterium]|nr:IS66 family transposase [Nitrospinota bacterium]
MDIEEAKAIYRAGENVVVKALLKLDAQVRLLENQVKELQIQVAKLSKNSQNSSKRPSSDDITKKKKKKKGSKKLKKGAQPGHEKHERSPFPYEDLDYFHPYELDACPECGGTHLKPLDLEPRIIQQVELEKFVLAKEEHCSYAYWCEDCQKVHYAPFPDEVYKEGLFKARLTALVAYMKNVCHASFSTIRKFIKDILGEKVSRGYLSKLITKVSQSLEKPYEELLDRLPLETIINVDETGHKENGDRFWTWVFKAELYVLFRIDKSRGSQVLIEVLGQEFNGVLGCDYFSAYRKFMKDFNVSVQFCLAHLIRNIKFLTSLPDKETKAYGEKLLQAYRNLFKIIHEQESVTKAVFRTRLNMQKQLILKIAIDEAPSKLNTDGKEEKKEAQNMANRFRLYGDAYFAFITTPGVDPTNNIAEQAIRFVVIDRHVTQGTRGINGRKANERLWTVIATCSLHGRSAYDFILKAVQAYFKNEPAPSLLVVDTS